MIERGLTKVKPKALASRRSFGTAIIKKIRKNENIELQTTKQNPKNGYLLGSMN